MDDREMVRTLLGRAPQGRFDVVVRDDAGWPVVIRNAPLLDDGTPMPTRYWLVGEDAVRRVGRLEAAGGVRDAERAVDAEELAEAHRRHAAERDAEIPEHHTGPRPSGGVGGTREGVKCLHAHYAWFLAGGDDPVGRWVDEQLRAPAVVSIALTSESTVVECAAPESGPPWREQLPVGIDRTRTEFGRHDPPNPSDLSNAVGLAEDHFDDLRRLHPELIGHTRVVVRGPLARTLAQVELGHELVGGRLELDRDAAEDVFRTLVTESAADRAHNPGLPADHVHDAPAAATVLVAAMRRFHLDHVTLDDGSSEG